jgi:hypothetical protein
MFGLQQMRPIDRFPTLRIDIAAPHAGWLSIFVQVAGVLYPRHDCWAEAYLG